MKELKFPLLSADDIECRIGTCSDKGVSLLLYKDARVDMKLLDQVVGAFNWQREHKELKGNIYCGVSIYDDERKQWVTKWDCGKESNTEAEKGEASDSFKRACFNIGVGRELYSAPFIWVAGGTKNDRYFVDEIAYNEKERTIKKLIIKHEKTKQVAYTFCCGYDEAPTSTPKPQENKGTIKVENIKVADTFDTLNKEKGSITNEQFIKLSAHKGGLVNASDKAKFETALYKRYSVNDLAELSESQANDLITRLGGK